MERASRIGCFAQKKRTRPLPPRTSHTKTTDATGSNTGNDYNGSHSPMGGGKIRSFTDDYANIHIEENSVIYCDIPYKDTNRYQKEGFDFERFYDWCFRQTEPVFISSYWMPSDFEEVAQFQHISSLSATKTNQVVEKIFVPKSQSIRVYNRQLSLFD